jgi:hypothetical protein
MDKIPKDQIEFLLRHVAEIKEKKRKEMEKLNKDLLVAFWETLDQDHLPGEMRNPREPDFSSEESNGLRTFFEMAHRSTARWIEGTFDDWRYYEEENVVEIQRELSDTEKALQAITNLSNEYHTALSFNNRTPSDHPQFQQLQMQFLSGLQLQISKPRLLISNPVSYTHLTLPTN